MAQSRHYFTPPRTPAHHGTLPCREGPAHPDDAACVVAGAQRLRNTQHPVQSADGPRTGLHARPAVPGGRPQRPARGCAIPLYETVTADLLRLQNVIKSAP